MAKIFRSHFIPVNIKRSNAQIHSDTDVFPVDRLKAAVEFLRDGTEYDDISLNENCITFHDDPDIKWSVPDIYLAYEAYTVALECNYSYSCIYNYKGVPQLYVSSDIKGSRILINSYSFKSILISNQRLVKQLTRLVGHKFSNKYCLSLYEACFNIERGYTNYLNALIINRDTPDMCMVVSPISVMYDDVFSSYFAADLLDEYQQIIDGATETESLIRQDNNIIRKDLQKAKTYTVNYIKEILALYNNLLSRPNDYIELCNNDCIPTHYVSSNFRYLVNASNFQCLELHNKNIIAILKDYASNLRNNSIDLDLCWAVAASE